MLDIFRNRFRWFSALKLALFDLFMVRCDVLVIVFVNAVSVLGISRVEIDGMFGYWYTMEV